MGKGAGLLGFCQTHEPSEELLEQARNDDRREQSARLPDGGSGRLGGARRAGLGRGAGGNAEEGAEVFKKCRACHDVGPDAKNKVGPLLNGIIGRKAGTIEGFAYSEANKTAGGKGLTWTEDVLFKYLENPLDLHAGHEDGVRRPQGPAGPQGLDRLPEEVHQEIARARAGPEDASATMPIGPRIGHKGARASACSSPAWSTCSGRRSALPRSSCSATPAATSSAGAARPAAASPPTTPATRRRRRSWRARPSPPSRATTTWWRRRAPAPAC